MVSFKMSSALATYTNTGFTVLVDAIPVDNTSKRPYLDSSVRHFLKWIELQPHPRRYSMPIPEAGVDELFACAKVRGKH